MFRALACLAATSLATPAHAEQAPEVGDTIAITVRYATRSESESGSSSSSGSFHYIERVLAVSQEGVEREYLHPEGDEEATLAAWHLPVRVLEGPGGELVITNRPELEARRDRFMHEAEIPVEACGSWYFTWNAFQVQCEPDAILETIAYLDIQPDALAVGAPFQHDNALSSGTLQLVASDAEKTTYRAQMPVDPDAIRLERAQERVVVGEIMGEPTTLEDAIAETAGDTVEGTITVILVAHPSGEVHTRTVELDVNYTDSQDGVEHMTAQRITTRQPL